MDNFIRDDNQMLPGQAEPDGGVALHNVVMLGRMLRRARAGDRAGLDH